MIRTIEAVIEDDGGIRLLEPLPPGATGRAVLVILAAPDPENGAALLSERALQDWNRPEEDAAWSHLQPAE
jgi:hypothetical protein